MGNSNIIKDNSMINVDNSQVLPIFTEKFSLANITRVLGEFLFAKFYINYVALGCLSDSSGNRFKEFDFWSENESNYSRIERKLTKDVRQLAELINQSGYIEKSILRNHIGLPDEKISFTAFAIKYDKKIIGYLFIDDLNGDISQDTLDKLCALSITLGAPLAARLSIEEEKLSNYVFNAMLDSMKASIYITDLETDEILFMNQTMKTEYGLVNPEGHVCWKVLQKGMKGRCSFCPIEKLKLMEDEQFVYQWDEISSITGKSYQNYDSLIRWIDGRTVHLQQSIDVTELRSANTDELTQLLSRRPGKKALEDTIRGVEFNGDCVTVCLYDINMLKEINDRKGHHVGDQLISLITATIKSHFIDGEYAFRLNSDEFIAVFKTGLKATQLRLEYISGELDKSKIEHYGFSFGLIELVPYQSIKVDDVLFVADERMYEQKRRFHVKQNERKRQESMYQSARTNESFDFDKDLLYDAILQSTENYLFVCNMKTGVFRFSHAMKDEFDLPDEVVENATVVWGNKIHEEDRKAFYDAFQILVDGRTTNHCVEYRAKNNKGEWVWVRCRGHLEYNKQGEAALFAGFITNLDKKNQIDSLTGLYNKIVFEEQIEHFMASENVDNFGVMIIGIDELKHINDLYNRTFGDEVIRIVSQRIQSLIPHTATVYRLDGDEFGIIVRLANSNEMQSIYNKIAQSFKYQQEFEDKKYYCSLSAGVVQYPQDSTNYLDLLKYAGYSLEYSKTHGKKCCTPFSKDILDLRSRSLGMVEALRESVENDFAGFSLVYQPLVNASSGKLFGVEALARWEHKDFGKVSPMEFIPLLEKTGLIEAVGKWVLSTAISTCREWQKTKKDLIVDVNLSYRQLGNDTFITFVNDVLNDSGYPPENLVLELTESHFANDNAFVQKIFDEIRALGVGVAMDDFGTGYSSLGILKESPADMVKIDKTFVRDIKFSHFDSTFIKFVVVLCHDVGIKVCLEGVETEEQYQVVKQMGLDFIQGYLFDKPLSVKEFSQKYIFI